MTGIPSPAVGVWYLGPVPVRAYALAILTGIIVGGWLASRRYRARGGPEGAVLDAVMWAVPFGIIGARIYHVVSSPDRYFGPDGDPLLALRIWEGGLGVWGAIPAGALGAWIALRRAGLRLPPFADAMAPGILLAQAIGRLGNYFNQELFGRPTTLPWGLQIDPDTLRAQGLDYPDGTLFHPTFLYEMLWCLGVAALLIVLDRRFKLRHGRVFWLYVALYTLGRVWIESLRIDEAQLVLGLRLNVWTSILLFAVALTVFVVLGVRTRDVPDPIWAPGREPATDGGAAVDEGDAVHDGEKDAVDDGTGDAVDDGEGDDTESGTGADHAAAPDEPDPGSSTATTGSETTESGTTGPDSSSARSRLTD